MEQEKPNTFAELEQQENPNKPAPQAPVKSAGEISVDNFSDVALKDKVKYNRPNLNGTEDVIESFKVFMPDPEKDELQEARDNKNVHYWKVSMVLTYESKNEDGINNREYISGAISFKQKDGTPSDISFWYEGCEHQSGMLWELVAKAKGKEPAELSPREFVVFLNSKPKVKIVGKDYKNLGAQPGAPKNVTKNMPGEFIVA